MQRHHRCGEFCHPEARGRVRLHSGNPDDPPRITAAMLDTENDRDRLLKGCRIAYEALLNGPCRKFGGAVYAPSLQTADDEEWRRFIRETAALNWHPTSTCRMGTDQESVVDSEFCGQGLVRIEHCRRVRHAVDYERQHECSCDRNRRARGRGNCGVLTISGCRQTGVRQRPHLIRCPSVLLRADLSMVLGRKFQDR